ncbi:MAG: hypothetical protein HY925_04710 [Elusimicrobia bacterium]|nr:hypothetical protein [Elusimicrobiota bacterium]
MKLALAALLALCACGRSNEPAQDGPVPALSRSGSRWQVSRGDRRVFTFTNEAGKVKWAKGGETDSLFVSGVVSDPKEDARIKTLLRQSRHFRDLVNRLSRAGYGVSPAEPPSTGG